MNTKPYSASLILIDQQNRILLLKRDNKPGILFPNCWSIIGGTTENDESAEDTIIRECFEETGIRLTSFQKFLTYESIFHFETVFWTKMNISDKDISLGEGDTFCFTDKGMIKNLEFGFSADHIINLFYNSGYVGN